MADQTAGSDSPYLASNPSGIGSILFDKAPDLLSVHLENLRGVDKAIEQQKEQRAVANKVAAKILEYKNPDMNGIFPKDREELQNLGKDLVDAQVKLAKVDRNSPEWESSYRDLENKKQQLATYVGSSKAFNRDFTQMGDIVTKDKNKDADFWSKGITQLTELPMADRYGDKYIPLSNLVRDTPPTLDEAVDTFYKKTYPDQITKGGVTTTELGDNGNAIYQRKKSQNVTDEQIQEIKKGFRSMPELSKAFDAKWELLNEKSKPTVDALMAKYPNDPPVEAERKAKDDYMEGVLRAHQMNHDEYVYKQLSEQGKKGLIEARSGAQQQKNADFGAALNIADFWNAKPGAEKAFINTALDKSEYKTLQPVSVNGSTNVVPIAGANKIVDAGYDNGKPYIITTESQDPNAVINGAVPDGVGGIISGSVKDGGKIFFASPRALTYAVYGKHASKVHDAFALSNALTGDKDYDVQKLAPVSKWANKSTEPVKQGKAEQPSWFNKPTQQTPSAKQVEKKNFATLGLEEKKKLQSQSGAKTKEEFQKWLDKNGYTY